MDLERDADSDNRPAATDPLDELERLQADQPEPAHTLPVLITLGVVLAETVALAIAAHASGSAVLFAEAAQSLAGAGVELFLLLGVRRANRPADDAHPLGHGREAFFWSLLASVGVFVGGGVVSISYGLRSLTNPPHGEAYLLGYVVLAVIVVADGWTLAAAVAPLRRSAIVGRIGFRRGLRQTSDAAARTLIFDNAAAVLGSVIGILGLAVHQATGNPRADAAASMVIGIVLLLTTVALLHVNRELLTDRSLAPEVVTAMRHRIAGQPGIVDVPDLVAVYTGPHAALVTGTVVLHPTLDVGEVEQALAEVGERLAGQWPGELRVYLSPVPARA
ncbi:MAG: cation diffusion facilitator family transporter [Jatrophihabitantaceae bacterium]